MHLCLWPGLLKHNCPLSYNNKPSNLRGKSETVDKRKIRFFLLLPAGSQLDVLHQFGYRCLWYRSITCPFFNVSIVSTEDTRHPPSTSCTAWPLPVTLAQRWVEDHAHCESCLLHYVYTLTLFAFLISDFCESLNWNNKKFWNCLEKLKGISFLPEVDDMPWHVGLPRHVNLTTIERLSTDAWIHCMCLIYKSILSALCAIGSQSISLSECNNQYE